jgi:hypothetical protein
VRSGANQERNKLDLYRMLQTADFAELKDVFTRFFLHPFHTTGIVKTNWRVAIMPRLSTAISWR